MRGGAIIKIFSIIALVFALLQISLYFFYYNGATVVFNTPHPISIVKMIFSSRLTSCFSST